MSAESVGQIGLDLVVNQNQYQRQLSGITSMAKKAGATIAAAFGVKKLIDFGKSCIELGSDLQEVQNVVDVTFPSMSAQVDQFAKSAAASFGLSETMAKKYAGTFGAMAKAFGFSENAAYEMSTALTGLAGDVASFYNISQDEAYTKLKSVFSGETETLKDLGVVMTQSALDAYALANGFGKTTKSMSEMEKVSLRYAFVQDQLSNATGDFSRTSDSWANQVRIMKLQMESFMATVGQGLINLFTPVIKTINTVIGKLQTLANAFKKFTDMLTGKDSSTSAVAAAGDTASDSLSSATSAADGLADSTSSAGAAAKKAAKEMKSLMGFDMINKQSDDSDSSSDSGGSSGGSGGSGGAGGAGSGLGSTVLDDVGEKTDNVSKKFEKMFNNIKKGVEPTVKSLKRLWNEGLSKLGTFTWKALEDFYNDFLVPLASWTFGTGLPGFIDALNNGLMNIDYGKINTALDNLWKELEPFAENVGEGLLWFWTNVLVPLGTWTANEVVPRFLETLTTVISIFNTILTALKPLFQWFWDNVLVPLASWVGEKFLQAWDGINDALKIFSDWLKDNTPSIDDISDALESMHDWIQKNKTVIEVIAITLAGFTAAIVANIIADNAITIAMGASSIAIGVYTGVTTIATAVTGAFSAVMAFLTSPITLVIAAITLLVVAGVLLYKNWDKIKIQAKKLWESIKKTFGGIGDWFGKKVKAIKDKFKNIGSWFKDKFKGAYKNVTRAFSSIGDWFGKKRDAIKNKFKDIGGWFKDKFKGACKNSKEAWSTVGEYFGKKRDSIKSKFSTINTWFKDKFKSACKKSKDSWSTVGEYFAKKRDAIHDKFSGIGDWFSEKFSGAYTKVTEAFAGVGDFFGGLWDTIKEKFSDIGTKVGDAIGGAFKTAINAVLATAETIVNTPINAINGLLSTLKKVPGVKQILSGVDELSTFKLPRLAQGGYVKKNAPQLAMIGDNRHQGEVVAPEDKLTEMERQAAAMTSTGVSSAEVVKLLKEIIALLKTMDVDIVLDGDKLVKKVVTKINRNTIATGKCAILT